MSYLHESKKFDYNKCPHCGSTDIQVTGAIAGLIVTHKVFIDITCSNCGASWEAIVPIPERLTVNVYREPTTKDQGKY